MDTSQTQSIIGWVVGVFAVGIISVITGIYSIIRASRMIPKEVKGAELDNRSKEVSIADQYDELATRAADKALKTQERLDKIEKDYSDLKLSHSELKDKVESQDIIIAQQAEIIQEQSDRLDSQEIKIREQEEEINTLRCELNNSKLYNDALIQQMKQANIIPVEVSSLNTEDCTKSKSVKRKKVNEDGK